LINATRATQLPCRIEKVVRAACHEFNSSATAVSLPPAGAYGLPMKRRRAASRVYLLEELAAITLQGAAERSARIHPGPELASFKALRQGLVPGAPPIATPGL
jgi:hypothetical protein